MQYKALLLACYLPLVVGCKTLELIKPGVEAPDTVASLTYTEIDSLGDEVYSDDYFSAEREAWGGYGMPNRPDSCRALKWWYEDGAKRPESVVNAKVKACAAGIQEEKIRIAEWRAWAEEQSAKEQAKQEAAHAAREAAIAEQKALEEAERERKKRFLADRQERLESTRAYPMLESLPKKPLQFANTHRPGINDIAVLAGCTELGLSPTGTSYDRSGRTLEVYFEGIEYPHGKRHTTFKFIENEDYWFVDRVVIGNQNFTYPGQLIPLLGGFMNRGDCL